jgi:hypothetical protein
MMYLRGEINGVGVKVLDSEAYAKFGGGDSYLEVDIYGKTLFWVYGRLDWGNITKISEYRHAEIDFAVPQSFFREHGRGYVWYYTRNRNGNYASGCPLAKTDILESARKMVAGHYDWHDLAATVRHYTQEGVS